MTYTHRSENKCDHGFLLATKNIHPNHSLKEQENNHVVLCRPTGHTDLNEAYVPSLAFGNLHSGQDRSGNGSMITFKSLGISIISMVLIYFCLLLYKVSSKWIQFSWGIIENIYRLHYVLGFLLNWICSWNWELTPSRNGMKDHNFSLWYWP